MMWDDTSARNFYFPTPALFSGFLHDALHVLRLKFLVCMLDCVGWYHMILYSQVPIFHDPSTGSSISPTIYSILWWLIWWVIETKVIGFIRNPYVCLCASRWSIEEYPHRYPIISRYALYVSLHISWCSSKRRYMVALYFWFHFESHATRLCSCGPDTSIICFLPECDSWGKAEGFQKGAIIHLF